MNVYAYVGGNTVNLIDPMGLMSLHELITRLGQGERLGPTAVLDELHLTSGETDRIHDTLGKQYGFKRYSPAELSPGQQRDAMRMFPAFSPENAHRAYAMQANEAVAKKLLYMLTNRQEFEALAKGNYYLARGLNVGHFLVEKGLAVGQGIARANTEESYGDFTTEELVTGDRFDARAGAEEMVLYIGLILAQQKAVQFAGAVKTEALTPVGGSSHPAPTEGVTPHSGGPLRPTDYGKQFLKNNPSLLRMWKEAEAEVSSGSNAYTRFVGKQNRGEAISAEEARDAFEYVQGRFLRKARQQGYKDIETVHHWQWPMKDEAQEALNPAKLVTSDAATHKLMHKETSSGHPYNAPTAGLHRLPGRSQPEQAGER